MNIVKIGPVELYEDEALRLYNEGKYIMTYSKIYQLHFGGKGYPRVYGTVIYNHPCVGGIGLARRGRYYKFDAAEVNNVLGFQLIREA